METSPIETATRATTRGEIRALAIGVIPTSFVLTPAGLDGGCSHAEP